MSKIVEKIKDWFTDVVGAGMMIFSLIMVYCQQIEFIYTGFFIFLSGFVIMTIPDKEIATFIKEWAAKKFNNDNKE